ncbi:uncharacterized protein PV09_00451 [Verruconis gallopava]|uniref:FAD/NAD(P)-binding domain-containing protein n=1 Tax=Verruconis gallopava TaxID=253628 RepID=A0A0D2BDW6_9PEZI|nr:uncharacterized protein PV09_00451 [Verruconis gallopava]KIW09579.1 hypothetical protein PV09_00451 [Verruconis gallopava]
MPLRRDMGAHVGGENATYVQNSALSSPVEELDALVVGAGFSGCKLLHDLRKKGFKVKVVEAGSDLGGIWHWNKYPGARVDSQYPVYALDIPEVYETWSWSEQYPGVDELQRYFAHVEAKLDLKKDMYLNTRVTAASFNASTDKWLIEGETTSGTKTSYIARFFIPCIGFAAKRHIPDWPSIESFKGEIYHSSFWPDHVDVRGKRVAVIGQGATGVQIAQQCAHDVGPDGELFVFVRTPNIALAMQQAKITPEQNEANRAGLPETLKMRLTTLGGFHWNGVDQPISDFSMEERERMMEEMWQLGGFRILTTFNDILLNEDSNRQVYDFWAKKVRARIHDDRVKDILAPLEPPHPFGAKRPSLEQDYYDSFNKPNVHCISIKDNPIIDVTEDGIVLADGSKYEMDIIALATGFDSVNGGMKDIKISGIEGETIQKHWEDGTYTYLGMTCHNIPNFFFTYGAQAPTAFSNGPSCLEPQCEWIERVMESQRKDGWTRINATRQKELEWKEMCEQFSAMTLRHNVKSWYMGTNIPGKKKEALNYSGGLPLYIATITDVANKGWEGFVLSAGTAAATEKDITTTLKGATEHIDTVVNGVPA